MMRQRLTKKIGVLGGSFDPIHLGHLIVAERVVEERKLDLMLFIPCNLPPHKEARDVSPGIKRLRMVEIAVRGNPRFRACDIELRRGGISYSVDSLMDLKKIYGGAEIDFVIGADSLAELSTWKDYGKILSLCRIVTVCRPGFDIEAWPAAGRCFTRAEIAEVRRNFVAAPLIDISSTDIRKRRREGRSIRYLVPDAVEGYIKSGKLYAARSRRRSGGALDKPSRGGLRCGKAAR